MKEFSVITRMIAVLGIIWKTEGKIVDWREGSKVRGTWNLQILQAHVLKLHLVLVVGSEMLKVFLFYQSALSQFFWKSLEFLRSNLKNS